MNTGLIPDHVFRGYDLRGLADSELTEDNVKNLAKAYATWLIQRRITDCVLGYDCRTSGPKFAKACIQGLTESGINVYALGMTLTQIAYFAQYYFRTRGMMMITASHNPKEYNGFKLATGYSETMLTHDVIAFRELYKSGSYMTTGTPGTVQDFDIREEYFKDVLRHVGPITPMKVVVDACSATAGAFLPELLRKAGCDVVEQNTTPDGSFPTGTPDPTERHVLTRLGKRVVEEHADLGFAYDADGDRMGVVDAHGTLIWNDTLCALYAKDILHHLPHSKIVFNVLCSKSVTETIEKEGGIPIMWKTGHSYIKEKVKIESAPFGGELSGHFFFLDNFYGHEDGAIASLRLLAYLSETKKPLHEEVALLPQYVSSPEIKLGCPDAVKIALISGDIASKLKALYPDASYNEIDGVRMDTESEMIIIRASQNGPYITVKFEAKTQEAYDVLKDQISGILHEHPVISFEEGVNVDSFE